jgi:predicted AAA+ superfamily ATPase
MWIQRDISALLEESKDPVQIIRGPRQCGKSSLVLNIDPSFKELSLDDPSLRELAQTDPELFLNQFGEEKLFIDEAQYAPELFPSIKRRIDLAKRDPKRKNKTIIRMTGSNQILMDKNIKESLAGRASFFDMNTLSVSEILDARKCSIQEILYLGGWPELHANNITNPRNFLDDYINSYIEKDVVLAAGIQKSRDFLRLVKLLAGRVGQILDLSSLGKDLGIDAKTIKDWVSILERMHVIALVIPFHSNLSKRLIKSPKVYFIDTGLACRLQGWVSSDPILTSPQQGSLFENLVFSEIYKLNINYKIGLHIYHWRTRDGEEIDFLLQLNKDRYLFIEAKVSPQVTKNISTSREVLKVFKDKLPESVIVHQNGNQILNKNIPIAMLKKFLLKEIQSNR